MLHSTLLTTLPVTAAVVGYQDSVEAAALVPSVVGGGLAAVGLWLEDAVQPYAVVVAASTDLVGPSSAPLLQVLAAEAALA
jgi:hypothetical protein